jgi:hypothetical protein
MQEAETRRIEGMRDMGSPSQRSFFKRMSLIAIAFLAMLAIVAITSAQETESIRFEPTPLWPYHALLVLTGLVFMFAGMITARYMKGKKWWLKAHKNLGLAGALFTVFGFIVAVYTVSIHLGIYLIRGTHAYIGVVALLLVVFTPIMGFMQLRKKDKRIRIIHRWSGRLAIALMLINATLGLMNVSAA